MAQFIASSGAARSLSRGAILNEDEVLAFVHTEIGSVGAVELLIFLKTHLDQDWGIEELVLALRSSSVAVAQAINRLHGAGFVRQVQTSVSISSSVRKPHSRSCFNPRMPSSRQRIVMCKLKFQAAPIWSRRWAL